MANTDHRQTAQTLVRNLVESLKRHPQGETRDRLISESESLMIAIGAFHMEAIRFRMYNVDRLLARADFVTPEERTLFADTRHELEAAGFHTRSHQAPT